MGRYGNTVLAGRVISLRIGATGPINGAMIDMGNSPEQTFRHLSATQAAPTWPLIKVALEALRGQGLPREPANT